MAHEPAALLFPRSSPALPYDHWARSVIWQAERWVRHHMAERQTATPLTLRDVQDLRDMLRSIAAGELHRDLLEEEERLLGELLQHRVANVAAALGRAQPEIPSFLLTTKTPES